MRILNRYLRNSFTVTFLMSLMVITFVMCITIVFKVTDLIAQGVSWRPVVHILIYGFPQALTYSIPVSVLTGCLLVFGRMSSDGEITAMKASGVSMWAIVRPPCVVALLLSLFCIFNNNELVPMGHLAGRVEIAQLGLEAPLELLEEGRFIQDFPGMTLYIGEKRGAKLHNVRIYDMRKEGIRREVRAASGTVREERGGTIALDLYEVRIDPFSDDRPGAAYCDSWTVTVPRRGRDGKYTPDKDDKTFLPLIRDIGKAATDFPQFNAEDLARYKSSLKVEVHKRLSLGAACFAFAMLGIPLGIKAHRKESSVGIAISLLVVFCYYAFLLAANSLEKRPEFQPHLLAWTPILLAMAIGGWLVKRHN